MKVMGTVTEYPPEGTLFAPDAFDRQVGTVVELTWRGQVVGEAKVLAVEVSKDGRSAALTIDSRMSLNSAVGALVRNADPTAEVADPDDDRLFEIAEDARRDARTEAGER